MLGIYQGNSTRKPTALSEDSMGETEQLVTRYQTTREEAVRARILKQFERMSIFLARRFLRSGEPLEDLLQEASIGLLRAIDLFDETKGVRFSTYAACRITTSLEHYLRDRAHMIRQPAWIQERNHRLRREIDRFRSQLGREPEWMEIADHLELSPEELEALHCQTNQTLLSSLDELVDEESGLTRGESISTPDNSVMNEDRLSLEKAALRLTDLEWNIITMIYYQQLTQREAAQKLGTSASTIRRLLANALKRLRREMVNFGYGAN